VSAADSFTLFVYGTLMRGGGRHPLLAEQRFLGETRTRPLYALFDLGAYPGMVRRYADGQAVYGELYEVAVRLIPLLDKAEGAPTLYRLEPIELEGWDGPASAYLYQQSVKGKPVCPDNRWVQREWPR
jgi:gamma-glutamylaminecyclotransferase